MLIICSLGCFYCSLYKRADQLLARATGLASMDSVFPVSSRKHLRRVPDNIVRFPFKPVSVLLPNKLTQGVSPLTCIQEVPGQISTGTLIILVEIFRSLS
jgi:hypothetical protein